MTEQKKSKAAPTETEKLESQFNEFDTQVKNLTMDRMNQAPKLETEPQTKLASSEIEKMPETYLKPHKAIMCRNKFNEKFREDYNFAKQYVQLIAENNEVKGDMIEMWTKPFAGVPAEFWQIPVNKPIWAPRYVAEQIRRKSYHRLSMDQSKAVESSGAGTIYGHMVVDNTIQRLDARPISTRKSIFMGAT